MKCTALWHNKPSRCTLRIAPVWAAISISAFGLVGCATMDRNIARSEVGAILDRRSGFQTQWDPSISEDHAVWAAVESIMNGEVTEENAVQVAILNNPSLQVVFEEVNIARADLVQAGLLKNPVFHARVGFPDSSDEAANTEFELVGDVLDILQLPFRRAVAQQEFDQTKYQVAHAVLDLVAQVRSEYRALQALSQNLAMTRRYVRAYEYAAEFAKRQKEAGNISELEEASRSAAYYKARLDLGRIETDLLLQRERMNGLLGLSGESSGWNVALPLPELPDTEPPLSELESLAMSNRLDLAAARHEVEKFGEATALEKMRLMSFGKAGVNTERETDGTRLTGPVFELEVPVFDQKQAVVARSTARWRQSEKGLAALERQALEEVRSGYHRLVLARRTAESYRETIIPLQEKVVEAAQKQYNYMLTGVYTLLQSKQDEIDSRRAYIDALRDYWISRVELERAMGSKLPIVASEGGENDSG